MKKIVFSLLLFTLTLAYAQGDIAIFSVKNSSYTDKAASIKASLEKKGFTIVADTNMIKPFTVQFKKSDYKIFHLVTAYHTTYTKALVKKYPDAGIFAPMGFGIYQHNNESTLHVSMLTAKTMAHMLQLKTVDPLLVSIEHDAMQAITYALPNAKKHFSKPLSKPLHKPLITRYVYTIEEDDDAEDIVEETAMSLENNLGPLGFILSNTLEFNDVISNDDKEPTPFEVYNGYSICKLKVIYNVAKTHPEAAAFAPCTLMMYKQKGKNEIVMGFPSVYNWLNSAGINDSNANSVLLKAQEDFESVLSELTE